ncbi:MAG: hypothetical protein LQ351_003321 [Letrouitia transgressa]|nr:MAG: hypothetical protein LQ351_003321 [Letrouitia transgressa]
MSRPRPRRTSSSVGNDLRGDTDTPALSTLQPTPQFTSPPLSPRNSTKSQRRHTKRRKARSYLRHFINFSFHHPWVAPLIFILVVLSAYLAYPFPSNPVRTALFLSYPLSPSDPLIPAAARSDPSLSVSTHYGKGPKDFAFVAFYAVFFSFTREFLMQRVLRPMARRHGLRTKQKQFRFMEQMYTACYFGVFGPLGLYVMYRSPVWYFRMEGMYEGFPHRSHDGLFKAYYLLQASYWAQQAIVLCLGLEKRRKDFTVLVAHHVVTLALIGLSYRFHFTYMGLAVYITHDVSDFFLATSKSLSYVESSLVSPYFSFFMAWWVYLRHYTNLRILHSILTTFATVGPFELDWEIQQYKCWISQYITLALLACLQGLNIFWLYFIVRVAVMVVWKGSPKDERSDDEDEGEDEGEERESDWEGKKGTNENGTLIEGSREKKKPSPGKREREQQQGPKSEDEETRRSDSGVALAEAEKVNGSAVRKRR